MSENKMNEKENLDKNSSKTTSKQTAELISNWYQSYYSWNLAYINSSVMMNSNLFLTSCNNPIINNFASSNNFQSNLNHQPSQQQRQTNNNNNNNSPRIPIVTPPQLPHLVNYKVPSLARRFMAEFLDAIYIQFVKITIALILLNYTDLINEDSFRIFDLVEDILNEDNFNNIRLPFELLLLEIFYVATSVVFETLCLYKRSYTPGKYLFGLRVISCINVTEEPNQIIRVIPGTQLSLKNILLRTCLKNFSIIFLFPTIIFFILPALADNGQTSYDKASDSIVVQIS